MDPNQSNSANPTPSVPETPQPVADQPAPPVAATPASTPSEPAPQPAASQPPATPREDKVFQFGKYQVKVIRSLCIGAASCVAVSPSTFKLDKENKAVVQEGSTDTPDNILMAAQSCPTKAIVVIDTETGKQVWPA